MPDLSKVSQKLQNYVADVAKMEGNKKQIDTQTEFDKLSEYLSGHAKEMNVHEKAFVEGLMVEYTNKAKEQEITKDTKKLVKEIARRTGNKKVIDSDEEAQALALALKNTKGDFNEADLNYIKNVLVSSGYANYVEDATPKEEAVKQEAMENEKMEAVEDEIPEVNTQETKNCDCEETKKVVVPQEKADSAPAKPVRKQAPKKTTPRKSVPNSSTTQKTRRKKKHQFKPDKPSKPTPKQTTSKKQVEVTRIYNNNVNVGNGNTNVRGNQVINRYMY